MTPRQIVEQLDKHIIGQAAAKRAVAIAVRNRWRRQKVEAGMRKEIGPKNMLMIGPTGVGKTEIARRLALLTGAPFIKVEATKYTEVGYYGRDVESIVRDLVENAIGIVRTEERIKVADQAQKRTNERLIDLLVEKFEQEAGVSKSSKSSKTDASRGEANHSGLSFPDAFHSYQVDPNDPMPGLNDFVKGLQTAISQMVTDQNAEKEPSDAKQEKSANEVSVPDQTEEEPACVVDREEIRLKLEQGLYEDETIAVDTQSKNSPVVLGGMFNDSMETDLQSMFESFMPKQNVQRHLAVRDARKVINEQECEELINKEKVNAQAIELAENLGIVFIDEIDKIVASEKQYGADVSRQGVQRDLLPIVEGTTVQTKYGFVSTEHVLFIAAGAFHRAKPTDLMPELQGRFPIRVELSELTQEDFVRILKEPEGSLVKQYEALMQTEGVSLSFTEDALESLAEFAFEVNQTQQNIGARRLYTMMERLLEELSFEAPDMKMGNVVVNAAFVSQRLKPVIADEDLSKFIL
ncbi:MAG: ATP-dependent protease ATPase subunit HslU [Thermoguttaceae bacterium]|nr:ATP-dependent protease ATPase subunit HslU [Thermoguttaceae bacterium]